MQDTKWTAGTKFAGPDGKPRFQIYKKYGDVCSYQLLNDEWEPVGAAYKTPNGDIDDEIESGEAVIVTDHA